jgi:hypothetical protein
MGLKVPPKMPVPVRPEGLPSRGSVFGSATFLPVEDDEIIAVDHRVPVRIA